MPPIESQMLSSCAADFRSFFNQIYEHIYNTHGYAIKLKCKNSNTKIFLQIQSIQGRSRQCPIYWQLVKSANTTDIPVFQSSIQLNLGRPSGVRLTIDADTWSPSLRCRRGHASIIWDKRMTMQSIESQMLSSCAADSAPSSTRTTNIFESFSDFVHAVTYQLSLSYILFNQKDCHILSL